MSGGLLPPQWVRATVEQMCDILSGYGFPIRLQGRSEGEVPFFKVGDISNACRDGSCRLREAQHYLTKAEADSIKARALPVNTVVFAKIGEAISLNRRAVLDVPGIVDNNCMGVWDFCFISCALLVLEMLPEHQ
jgi:type I restriction enzyme S subunit